MSCLTSRGRDAPSAVRIAISPLRAVARASSRLATLPQAIRSTSPTAPMSTMSDRAATSPTTIPRYRDQPELPRLVLRIRLLELPRDAVHLDLRLRDGNARRQAAHASQEVEASHGRILSAERDGRRTWTPIIWSTSGGSTPMTVCGRPSMLTVVPTMPGFSPKCCCQSACEMMATS